MNATTCPIARNTMRHIGVITLGVGLLACGSESGGGNESDDEDVSAGPVAPDLSLTAHSIKRFAFSWPEVSGATGYRLLENPDDASGYTEIASFDADATGYEHEVFLPGRINASYILEACTGEDCADSEAVFVDTNLAEAVGFDQASNTGDDDDFGFSVALADDGTTLAVGARGEQSAATGIGDPFDTTDNERYGAIFLY